MSDHKVTLFELRRLGFDSFLVIERNVFDIFEDDFLLGIQDLFVVFKISIVFVLFVYCFGVNKRNMTCFF